MLIILFRNQPPNKGKLEVFPFLGGFLAEVSEYFCLMLGIRPSHY